MIVHPVPMPAQFVIYVAAKAAVVTISESIRDELLQENIGVTVLCPGPIRTNIGELAKNRPPQFGVGDAFRGGFMKGLAVSAPYEVCARMGSVAATYALEHLGGTSHAYTWDEFEARYKRHFGPL